MARRRSVKAATPIVAAWPASIRDWLVDTGVRLPIAAGYGDVRVLELRHSPDDVVLDTWAAHYRSHYCADNMIDQLRDGTGLSRSEYLDAYKFPTRTGGLGPATRAGDFAEILVADYLEHLLKYAVPRTRYADKTVRNESTKGSDVIGYKIVSIGKATSLDELVVFETKAALSATTPSSRLQDAVDDSVKDPLRIGESLNAMKQRLLQLDSKNAAAEIARFQNPTDRPYTQIYGAVAILPTAAYDTAAISATSVALHAHAATLQLVVVRGDNLMELVHDLYERAARGA